MQLIEDGMRLRITLFIFMSLLTGPLMAKNDVQIYGFVEKATLVDKNLTLSAKLDTGAKSSSLNATNITQFELNGVPYLRFTVPTKDGETVFECKYIGKVQIKVRSSETNPGLLKSTPIRRSVVLLNVRLGNKERSLNVNLTNRKRFLYPLLLGRDAIIAFDGVVNPALTFTMKSNGITKQ
jgi:hypothetical protein